MSGLQPSASVLERYLGLRPRLAYVGPAALVQYRLGTLAGVLSWANRWRQDEVDRRPFEEEAAFKMFLFVYAWQLNFVPMHQRSDDQPGQTAGHDPAEDSLELPAVVGEPLLRVDRGRGGEGDTVELSLEFAFGIEQWCGGNLVRSHH